MSCLNDIRFSNGGRLIHAGAGCTWDEVYKAVDARGRIIVGGASDAGVGIAGYLLGGGYSMKTNQYGLGIDNVTEFEVALPNGSLVTANMNTNRDLFEALRVRISFTIFGPRSHHFADQGGGNNFGIVTRFTIKTHLARKTYVSTYVGVLHCGSKMPSQGGAIKYQPTEASKVKAAILRFVKQEQDQTRSIVAAFRHLRTRDGVKVCLVRMIH